MNRPVPRGYRAFLRSVGWRPDWLAGAPGFEPGNGGIKSAALPLGYAPNTASAVRPLSSAKPPTVAARPTRAARNGPFLHWPYGARTIAAGPATINRRGWRPVGLAGSPLLPPPRRCSWVAHEAHDRQAGQGPRSTRAPGRTSTPDAIDFSTSFGLRIVGRPAPLGAGPQCCGRLGGDAPISARSPGAHCQYRVRALACPGLTY